MTEPGDLLGKSFRDFRRNLFLVLFPHLLLAFLWILLSVFIALQVLLLFYFQDLGTPLRAASITFFAVLDLLICLIITAYCDSLQFGVIVDSLSGKKSSFSRTFSNGKILFSRMLSFLIAKSFILLFPLIVALGMLAGLVYLSGSNASNYFAIVLVFFFFLAFLYFLFLLGFHFMTLFTFPLLVEKKLSGFRVIVEAFNYGKNNVGKLFMTAFIICLIYAALSFGLSFLWILFSLALFPLSLEDSHLLGGIFLGISGLSYLMQCLVLSFFLIFVRFYIFNSYLNGNKFKSKGF